MSLTPSLTPQDSHRTRCDPLSSPVSSPGTGRSGRSPALGSATAVVVHPALALAWLYVPLPRFQEILVSKAQGVLFGSRQGGTRQSHAIAKDPGFNRRGRRYRPSANICQSKPAQRCASGLCDLRGAQGCNLAFHLITWGEHPRPTSRPASCPRMMGLVGWCGSNATIGNKGICQLASSDRWPGLLQ